MLSTRLRTTPLAQLTQHPAVCVLLTRTKITRSVTEMLPVLAEEDSLGQVPLQVILTAREMRLLPAVIVSIMTTPTVKPISQTRARITRMMKPVSVWVPVVQRELLKAVGTSQYKPMKETVGTETAAKQAIQ